MNELGRTLLLSPHLDDAAFSAHFALENPQTEVWTVFAGVPEAEYATPWDLRCGYKSGKQLMIDRRREDSRALSGIKNTHLDYLERAYVSRPQRLLDVNSLLSRIDVWSNENPGSTILIPAGAGVYFPPAWHEKLRKKGPGDIHHATRHHSATKLENTTRADRSIKSSVKSYLQKVLHHDYLRRRAKFQSKGMLANEDHLELRDVIIENRDRWNLRIGLYEEFPYAWSNPAISAVRMIEERTRCSTSLHEVHVNRLAKFQRIKEYTTQLRVMDPVDRRFERPESIPAVERYWFLQSGTEQSRTQGSAK